MKKFVGYFGKMPWFAALFLSVLAAGCGGSGQAPILGIGSDVATLVPTVTSVAPLANAVAVPVNTKVITAAFSKAMDPSSLTSSSFTLNCPAGTPVVGVVSYVAASNMATLTLPAASNLPPGTLCTATVTTAAKDTMGIALAANFVWTFMTSGASDTTAPRVIATNNADGALGVANNTRAGATFSEAMAPLTINNVNFAMKETVSGDPVAGTVSYSGVNAVFTPSSNLKNLTNYTLTIKGGIGGVADLSGNPMANDFVWSWTTGALADTTAPTVILVNPVDLAVNVAITSTVNATFSEAMDPLTITNATFALKETVTNNPVTGTVAFNAASRVATFTPLANLAANTNYTATVTTVTKDLAGNALAVDKVWSFTTAATPIVIAPAINLGAASSFGTFGGSAGMTNTGIQTRINGDIGSIATGTSMVTGFHDPLDIYTESPANIGAVNGKIYTCTNSTTGPTSAGPNAASCAIATQARLDAQAAYLALVAMPPGANPGANLANLTLAPGVYTSPSGSFQIEGGNLTLDAQGDANAVWVFQMATTLTVGGPGAAAPQSIILAGGAQAKNIYWQVGSFATINAAGGGTMVGTIISQNGASFSTAGNVNIVTLQGRVLSLGASVTLVDTVINTP
jgi:hypothetical protein